MVHVQANTNKNNSNISHADPLEIASMVNDSNKHEQNQKQLPLFWLEREH